MSIREITPNFHIFARNISHRFPSFLIAFAQICPLLLPEFPIAFARISGKSYGKFGQNHGKFGQKQWENLGKSNGKIWAKAMRKLGKAAAYISRKNYCLCPNFHCFFPAFPIAFARISHCFCPNFSFPIFFLGGHSAPPCLLRLCCYLEMSIKTQKCLPCLHSLEIMIMFSSRYCILFTCTEFCIVADKYSIIPGRLCY